MAKKAASTKMAPKKAASKKSTKKLSIPEVDTEKLTPEDAKKRVAAIYKLEKKIQAKRRDHAFAKTAAKIAKDNLKDAIAGLAQEIEEQRFGAGPLYPVN